MRLSFWRSAHLANNEMQYLAKDTLEKSDWMYRTIEYCYASLQLASILIQ